MTEIKIKFQNGLTFQDGINDIFPQLLNEFQFTDSSNPDFIVFGPYGNDLPPSGNYVRIGYFCECIRPDLTCCEWAFGVPREEEISSPFYQRIQWHGLDPVLLIKNIDLEKAMNQKTNFCNFIYSNRVPYREEFFRQLSKYKKIDAPGRSMNNMMPVEQAYTGNKWEVKRQFLSSYKFTIAFESYAYPGYQTEKLYDPMRAGSIPIYCGDPYIGEVFNSKSFINADAFLPVHLPKLKGFLEQSGQYTFRDYRPGTFTGWNYRTRRKLKMAAKKQKMSLQCNKLDFSPLIDQIIAIDRDQDLYLKMLTQPWLRDNKVPAIASTDRWRQIFRSK